MRVKAYDIIYCTEQEDQEDLEIVSALPSVLILDVDNEEDVADAISGKTGWLVEGFQIDVIG